MSINVCNDRSMASITSLPSGVSGSSLVLLSTVTASSSSTITFDSGIDSTYKEYIFKFTSVHSSNNNSKLMVNFRDGSTAYDATKTSTAFNTYHDEADSQSAIGYNTSIDLAQSTSVQKITGGLGNGNDEACSGYLHLFNPSSTTFVKHYMCVTSNLEHTDYNEVFYIAGYCNTTAAIDGVQFTPEAGTIDAGTFKMYGVV